MSVALLSSAALAAPPQRENFEGFDAERIGTSDSYVHPMGKKQDALKQRALEAKVMGMASGKVHEVAKGQYVELERDRYAVNGDGDFDEPDGYIDHFQSVHAGEGEEAGGGAYGSDAIWSHRWYAFYNGIGSWGPGFNLAGGVQIGDTAFWVGDYTIEPENGGVGVFAHEFGHDLGLPDLYNTGGGPDNSVAYWSLMASGSWTSQNPNNIGSAPIHMGAWEKFQLGWLNYEVAFAGAKSEHKLGPAETNTKQAQGLFVVLPQKYEEVTVGDPFDGEYFYFSGSGNDLDNMMYREFTLAPASSLTAKANVQIEIDWDYAYLIVSDDGGANWTNVSTNLSTNTDPNGQNFGEGITGDIAAFKNATLSIGNALRN